MVSRWSRLALLTCVPLFLLNTAGALFFSPGGGVETKASGSDVVSWYVAHGSDEKLFDVETMVTLVFLVLFAAALRSHLRRTAVRDRAEDVEGLAALAFGGAVLFSAGFAVSEGIDYALSDVVRGLTPATAQGLNALVNMPIYAASIGGCAFGLGSGLAILTGAAAPKWLGWVALVLGILCVPAPEIGGNSLILWSVVVGVLLYVRSGKAPLNTLDMSVPPPTPNA